jgi:hypothetical protein
MPGKIKPLKLASCLMAISNDMCIKATREILSNIGISDIEISRDGSAAIYALQKRPCFDFVIAEDTLPIGGCLSIIKFIRFDRNYQNTHQPVLAIGASWTHDKIQFYRDSGISDILSFPVSLYSMQRRIISALYTVRPFITAENYCGPDRRHRLEPSYMGPFRRFTDVIVEQVNRRNSILNAPVPNVQNVNAELNQAVAEVNARAMSQDELSRRITSKN